MLKPVESELSFEDLGNATQRDVDELKAELFPDSAVKRAKLQSIWARHPTRLGEKRRYLYVIVSLCRIS